MSSFLEVTTLGKLSHLLLSHGWVAAPRSCWDLYGTNTITCISSSRCKFFSLTETPEDYTIIVDEEGFLGECTGLGWVGPAVSAGRTSPCCPAHSSA